MGKAMIKHFRVPSSIRLRLEESGVAVPAVLRRAGLPQDFFEKTRILVSTEELFALWCAIGEVSKDPLIGLLLGTGFLTGKITADTTFDTTTDLRSTFPRFQPEAMKANMAVVELLRTIGARKNASPAQVAPCMAVGAEALYCADSWHGFHEVHRREHGIGGD
jgi:hypothetical protein